MGQNESLRHKNAAVYFPRTRIPDPLADGRPRSLGASGTIAGLYARTDTERGVWKAPAGTDARLRNVLALDAVLTDAHDPERPMLFGHDPDFSDLIDELCGTVNAPMLKGSLARIEADRPLEAGGGTLRWLIPPNALKSKR